MKNILLINPWIYDFAAYNLWFRPLGLLSIAAVLKEAEYKLTLIDCLGRIEKEKQYGCGHFEKEFAAKPAIIADVPRRYGRYGMPLDEFRARLDHMHRPDAVLVTSFMTYWYPGLFKAVELVQNKFKGVPILAGGIYVTLCPEHAEKNLGSDVELVKGPGEEQALQKLDSILGEPSDYSLAGKKWPEFPAPLFGLYDNPLYGGVLTTRGCPYRCQYCASRLLYPAFEKRDPDPVVREISHQVNDLGVTDIAFFDDALLHKTEEHFEPILDLIITAGIKCNFHLPNGVFVRAFTNGLAVKMVKAGFKTIRLSFESSDPARQSESSNKVTNQELERAVDHLKRAGFPPDQIGVYLLDGLPDQTLEEVEESLAFVHRLQVRALLSSYALIPGTASYERSLKELGITGKPDPLLHNNSIHPLWRKKYGWETIYRLKNRAKELNQSLA